MNQPGSQVSIQQAISIATQALRGGKFSQAEAIYRRILEHALPAALTEQVHSNLGIALANQRKLDEALSNFRRAVELAPNSATVHGNLAHALKSQGRHAEAVVSFEQALRLQPDHVDALYNLGILHIELGDLDAAVRCFEEAIRHAPDNAAALFRLGSILRNRTPEEHVAQMERLLLRDDLSDNRRALLHAGFVAIFNATQDYERAAHHATRSNRHHQAFLQSRGARYNPDVYRRNANQITAAFDAEYFARVHGAGLDTRLPVFVFGLPRSGTTLVEQVLASHPQVYGAGEQLFAFESFQSLPAVTDLGKTPVECLTRLDQEQIRSVAGQHLDRLRRLDNDAERITNKMPDNYLLLGFVVTLFPQAILIHCRRDLRDVATSCWLTHFHDVPWTNDQQHIVAHIETFCRVMDHWRKVLPGRVHEIRYEDLVSGPETAIGRLLEACDLPWDPACRDFNTSDRPVLTASEAQARQPITDKSVGRYKNYETYLPDMLSALVVRTATLKS